MIKGVQAKGIGSAIKHFVANDMEHMRTSVNCIISSRALREIYLMPFQLAVREANPWLFMTAYNRVNGTHMSEHSQLLQKVVREEWRYDGCIVSDWYGTYSTAEAVEAGLDIEMPGPTEWRGKLLASAMGVQKIKATTIDERVSSILNLVKRCRSSGIPERGPEVCLDTPQDRSLLRQLATNSVVLLKNDKQLLPLKASKKVLERHLLHRVTLADAHGLPKTAVIGPNAKKAFFCGGGSASLKPYRSITIFDALAAELDEPPTYAEGCRIHKMLPVLGDLIRSPTGREGYFAVHMYSTPPWESEVVPFDSFELNETNIMLYDYSHPAAKDNVLYATITADITFDKSDTYTFGLTVAGTARLFLEDRLIVNNFETQTRGDSFFGSGSIEETGSALIEGGRSYRLRVEFGSAATSKLNKLGAPVFGAGGVRIGCARCTDEAAGLRAAVSVAAAADQVVLCVGLGPEWESEGADRTVMELPGLQWELISEVSAVNPNVVVVIQSGTPVSGPWEQVPAIIQGWYGGNESGFGVAKILFGKCSPSGKLPLSWPKAIEDNPAFLSHRSEAGRCYYSEDIYVGYRSYEKTKREVQWPFGHGLSYASFMLRDLKLEVDGSGINGELRLSLWVTNTSESMDGSEVCQAYVGRHTASIVSRPIKELKGFSKVFVPAGESKEVHMIIPIRYAVSIWDETNSSWLVESGGYKVLVGNSSAYTPLQLQFNMDSSYSWRGL